MNKPTEFAEADGLGLCAYCGGLYKKWSSIMYVPDEGWEHASCVVKRWVRQKKEEKEAS